MNSVARFVWPCNCAAFESWRCVQEARSGEGSRRRKTGCWLSARSGSGLNLQKWKQKLRVVTCDCRTLPARRSSRHETLFRVIKANPLSPKCPLEGYRTYLVSITALLTFTGDFSTRYIRCNASLIGASGAQSCQWLLRSSQHATQQILSNVPCKTATVAKLCFRFTLERQMCDCIN